MDLLSELELMAFNAEDLDLESAEIDKEDLDRWKQLFGFTRSEAENRIKEYRADLTRERISKEHWDMIRSQKTAEGHSRETFEYSLSHQKVVVPASHQVSVPQDTEYLLKLEGPLDTAAKVREAGGLQFEPSLLPATDDSDGEQFFVIVDGQTKSVIQQHFNSASFRPVFVRLSKARKALCRDSLYPTLGVDTMLPQFRPSKKDAAVMVQQDQYPVWYFFYGTLAEPDRLARLLQLADEPELDRAFVLDADVRTWAGKYKALVNGGKRVDGAAYLVACREHEEALRYYETDKYEVVRCLIHSEGGHLARLGLTFRFIDERKLT